jgi:hypothetical protein
MIEAAQAQQMIRMSDQDSQLRLIQQRLNSMTGKQPNEFSTTLPPP